ncbi:hypothetical protein H6P81_013894 [Aristolochia fimbriata]|uniref:Uncharacterized protein n=1 Tax=Aristolochia fimbriata TaxID=158543 RepID=A0AAV7EJA1_ARIFI|nr:hypothetical protein H6P81_013894 [Aristolochia fimbriata]
MATEGEDSCGVCAACRDRRVGPVELLEKYWFFHNTLHGVGVYDSSVEDSCTKNSLEMEVKDSNEAPASIFDVGSPAPVNDGSTTFPASGASPGEKRFHNSKLLRAPSLPPYIGKIEAARGEDRRRKPRETRLERNIGGSVSASSIVPTKMDGSLFLNHKLHRAPSLPPDIGWKTVAQGGGGGGERESRREPRKPRTQQKERSLSASAAFPKEETETQHLSRTNLVRAASLRPAEVKEEEEAEEEESRDKTRESSRLQRSMSSSLEAMPLFTPPGYRSYSSKTSKVPIIPRDRLPTNPNRQKSLSELEIEELQGFKDLGFTFNREDINPSILNVIPGLQENRPIDEERVRRPYLSEAWSVQRPNPPSLNWDHLNSRSVDMKEQLKVWARTVASNVGQKC